MNEWMILKITGVSWRALQRAKQVRQQLQNYLRAAEWGNESSEQCAGIEDESELLRCVLTGLHPHAARLSERGTGCVDGCSRVTHLTVPANVGMSAS